MKIEIIKDCPSCSSLLERVTDQLFCRNEDCTAKSNKKVLHYIKSLKIKGLGEKTVEKLGIETIPDIYNLLDNQQFVVETIGEKLGEKLFTQIEVAKTVDFASYIAAFGIPLVGKTIGERLSSRAEALSDITFTLCKECGIGDKASTNLVSWASSFVEENPITLIAAKKTPKLLTRNVCVTGKIEGYSRAKLKAMLESNGIKLQSSVSGTTHFLLATEGSTSSKHKTAVSKGIPIMTFENFIKTENIEL